MQAKIRLLEERVQLVVGRLGDLATERDRLQDELGSLRERLKRLEKEGSARRSEGASSPRWAARLGEIRSTLREAIMELRGE